MNICKTCKFWVQTKYSDFGECYSEAVENHKPREGTTKPNAICHWASDEWSGTRLKTGKNFGCIHHETKDGKES